jgi:FKBP-type peptidyl-prolyl cis-trans isomerase 2
MQNCFQVEPASAFPQENLAKEGAQFEGEDETGEVILYTVTNIADGKVVVDGNHPWAGQRIIFKATIKDVRSANQGLSPACARCRWSSSLNFNIVCKMRC